MSEPLKPGLRQSRAWFDSLEPLPQAFALSELVRMPVVAAMQGPGVLMGVPRDEAVALIMSGKVKRAPKAVGSLASCRIVVIGRDGFPVLLQCRPVTEGEDRLKRGRP